MFKKTKKIIIAMLVFVLTIVNYGLPIKAIATEGKGLFNLAFFKKDVVAFNVYFDDNQTKAVSNVNDTVRLIVEIIPKIEGYLESGNLKFNLENGNENNFKIKNVMTEAQEQLQKDMIKNIVGVNNVDTKDNEIINQISSELNLLTSEEASLANIKNIISGSKILVDENKEDTNSDEMTEEEMVARLAKIKENLSTYEAEKISDNEIELRNVIEQTKIFVDVEYKQLEKINESDLMSKILIELTGSMIDKKLKSNEVNYEKAIELGWEYSKNIDVNSSYVKVSPYTVGKQVGTIIDNQITISRNVEEKNYLPVKETYIEMQFPKIKDKYPVEVSLNVNRLMLTLGKDIVSEDSLKDCYEYDKENGLFKIDIKNKDLVTANGKDILNIVARYEDFIDDKKVVLDKNVKVKVTEASYENKIQEIEINEKEEVETKAGEFITFAVVTDDKKLKKGEINANRFRENKVETEFSSIVQLNVMTKEIVDSLILEPSKHKYETKDGEILDATEDVKYKGVRFKTEQLNKLIENGAKVEILDNNNNLLQTIEEKDNVEVLFPKKEESLKVKIININVNGQIDVEFIKAIEDTKYDISKYKNVSKLLSTVRVEVKYPDFEEYFSLTEMSVEKKFEESYTKAELVMDKANLSSIKTNENVEIKIELHNDTSTSDFYQNPSFEIVFPKYVKELSVNSIKTLFECGLTIRDYEVRNIDSRFRIKVNLDGTQTHFNAGGSLNGTNILVYANIALDELTPRTSDLVELYYFNEAATNYQSKTNWNMKDNGEVECGVDMITIDYLTPTGFVAVNSITNYDDTNEKVQSVDAGEIMKEVPMESASKVAKMELIALNNTGSECMDVVMFGRVPFKGNKDVVTNQDLGTTHDALMSSFITIDDANKNSVKIYYSEKIDANKNIDDSKNEWKIKEEIEDLSKIRSYLIIVDGVIKDGNLLKFSYDFIVPENLPYESKIAGSFGAFYNNRTELVTKYEVTSADLVGLVTPKGLKIDAKLEVDIGNNTDVGERRFLNYTLTVENIGNIVAENVIIENPIPKYTELYEYDSSIGAGNDNFVSSNKTNLAWNIEKLESGEKKVYTYMLKTTEIPSMETYYAVSEILKDEKGYYYNDIKDGQTEKKYIDENIEVFVNNKATVNVDNLSVPVESNETKNKIVDSTLDIEISKNCGEYIPVGEDMVYVLTARNITGKTINNTVVEMQLPEVVENKEISAYLSKRGLEIGEDKITTREPFNPEKIEYNKETRVVKVTADDMLEGEILYVYVKNTVIKGDNEEKVVIANYNLEDGRVERSTPMGILFKGPKLKVNQITNQSDLEAKEQDYIEFFITVKNEGNGPAEHIVLTDVVSENLERPQAEITGDINSQVDIIDGKIEEKIISLNPGKTFSLKISGNAKLNNEEKESYIVNKAILSADYLKNIETEEIKILLKENPNKVEDEITSDEMPPKDDDGKKEPEVDPSIENDDYLYDESDDGDEEQNQNQNKPSQDNVQNENNNNNDETNNTNKDEDNNENVNNETTNEDTENKVEEKQKYSISGKIWIDENRDGRRDDNEEKVGYQTVELYSNGKLIKKKQTDGNGVYIFTDVEEGNYNLLFSYDSNNYLVTTYQKNGVEDNLNSDAIVDNAGKAITNTFEVKDFNIENLDLGLIKREKFNMAVEKYITKSAVIIDGKEKVTEYDELKLGKIEIKAKDLNKSTVKLTYKINITNIGEVPGTIENVIDYLAKDMVFDEDLNKGWYLTEDGKVYNDTLKDTSIEPGEMKSLEIVLEKKMTEDNTGVISNKVEITKLKNKEGAEESNVKDNIDTQEMIITVKTGETFKLVAFITIIIVGAVLVMNGKNLGLRKVYK